MIVIFAEKSDMAIKFAAALGGIKYQNKTIHFQELNNLGNEIKSHVRKDGFVKTVYKGEECIITYGEGHVGTLYDIKDYDPSLKKWSSIPLPYIPTKFKVKPNEQKSKQIKIAKRLFNNPECKYIISATDYGREGELIFDYMYTLANPKAPYYRVRINEQTEQGIKKGFDTLYNEFDNMPKTLAARARSTADWITGINLTIAATLYYSDYDKGIMNVGRVITPTLNLLVQRDNAIKNYVKKTSYHIQGLFKNSNGEEYIGKLQDIEFDTKEKAQEYIKTLEQKANITSLQRKKRTYNPPRPYDTPTLQIEASQKFGFFIEQTDQILQKLYDTGYITYPRTESRFFTEDMTDDVKERVEMLGTTNTYKDLVNSLKPISIDNAFFNNSKVDDHTAIIPTDVKPTNNFTEDERKIYGLVAKGILRIAMKPMIVEKTIIETLVDNNIFKTSANIILQQGWNEIEKKAHTETKISSNFSQGDNVMAVYDVYESNTSKPVPYTDATLINAMVNCGKDLTSKEARAIMSEKKGIGTGATRASIINRLVTSKLAERKGKSLIPTNKGINIIKSIDIPSLKSPELTAEWEKQLSLIETDTSNNNALYLQFIEEVSNQTSNWVNDIKKTGKIIDNTATQTNLLCPKCHRKLIKEKYTYNCEACDFKISRIILQRELTEKEMAFTLKHMRSPFLKGFISKKTKKPFSAYLILNENYDIEFTFDSLLHCPKCGKPLRPFSSGKGYGCSGKNEGCDFKIWSEIRGHKLTAKEFKLILNNQETPSILDFKNDKGKTYSGTLLLDENCEIICKLQNKK